MRGLAYLVKCQRLRAASILATIFTGQGVQVCTNICPCRALSDSDMQVSTTSLGGRYQPLQAYKLGAP